MLSIINKSGFTLEYATKDSAGFDIYAIENSIISAGQCALIRTDLYLDTSNCCIDANDNFREELQIRGKSGLANKGIFAHFGTVDSDYPGEIKVILYNTLPNDWMVLRGAKIAQGVFSVVRRDASVTVKDEQRIGGFGSTTT